MAHIPGVWVHIPGSLGAYPNPSGPWGRAPPVCPTGTGQKRRWGKVGWVCPPETSTVVRLLSLRWGYNRRTRLLHFAFAPQCLELGQAISLGVRASAPSPGFPPPAGNVNCGVLSLRCTAALCLPWRTQPAVQLNANTRITRLLHSKGGTKGSWLDSAPSDLAPFA